MFQKSMRRLYIRKDQPENFDDYRQSVAVNDRWLTKRIHFDRNTQLLSCLNYPSNEKTNEETSE